MYKFPKKNPALIKGQDFFVNIILNIEWVTDKFYISFLGKELLHEYEKRL